MSSGERYIDDQKQNEDIFNTQRDPIQFTFLYPFKALASGHKTDLNT